MPTKRKCKTLTELTLQMLAPYTYETWKIATAWPADIAETMLLWQPLGQPVMTKAGIIITLGFP